MSGFRPRKHRSWSGERVQHPEWESAVEAVGHRSQSCSLPAGRPAGIEDITNVPPLRRRNASTARPQPTLNDENVSWMHSHRRVPRIVSSPVFRQEIPQCDGSTDGVDSVETTDISSGSDQESDAGSSDTEPDDIQLLGQRVRRVKLTSPSRNPFPPPPGDGTSPAISAFPFPTVEQSTPLSPLSTRWKRQSLPGTLRRPSWDTGATPQTPDRFIPFRRPSKSQRTSFQLSKPIDRLTDAERLCRSRFVSPDPFSPPTRSELQSRYLATRPPNAHDRTNHSGLRPRSVSTTSRQVSDGAVWGVGGALAASDGTVAVTDGRGGLFSSGTTAPLYMCAFQDEQDPRRELEDHERRIAAALEVDQVERLVTTPLTLTTALSPTSPSTAASPVSPTHRISWPTAWQNNEWVREGSTSLHKQKPTEKRTVPVIPFRVLDAPQLKDDFYCSLLAYSHTVNCLAVGLGNYVYLWSETRGVETPQSLNAPYQGDHGEDQSHVMSLSFSSPSGGKSILAVGRSLGSGGCLVLWSPSDPEPRFHEDFARSISCVCFRPNSTRRPSRRLPGVTVDNEDLLVGDEGGVLHFYSVEWPSPRDHDVLGWPGAMHLACRLTVHSQQICGFGWSSDGDFFASGSNDNRCLLFDTKKVLVAATQSLATSREAEEWTGSTLAKHRFALGAAIKAIAFCPFQRGLLALGGGSNDRCIHFYHTLSGAALATIDCAAQVTSLIWSTTRREIAATFGFANPEHAIRIAVFSWPACEQIVAIPWSDEARALHAIGYPGGPNPKGFHPTTQNADDRRAEGEAWCNRTSREGCLVIATSDASIKFHEVWSEQRRRSSGSHPTLGVLGGSAILESLHGVDTDEGDVIR